MPGSSKSGEDGYDRDRARRADRDKQSVKENNSRDRSPIKPKKGSDRRVYVSNIPYEYRWQELKDLFRTEVGEVLYVELFMGENDKSRGCGVIEFETPEIAQKAVEKMHRYDLKGRKLVVKEQDPNADREKQGRNTSFGNRPANAQSGVARWEQNSSGSSGKWGNTYGLSPAFLDSLGISGPLICKVFVANLDYKVDEKKLKEVFKLAGRVMSVDLAIDKEGKSRGFGTVEYEHPVEAVQAISMLHNQLLYERRINVRMDKSNERVDGPPKLPEGLRGIGMGLGVNGAPLTDVSRNLPSLNLSGVQPAVNPLGVNSSASALAALGSAALAGLGQNQLGGLGSSLDSRLLDSALARRQLEMVVSNQLAGTGTTDLGLRSSSFNSSLGNSSNSGNFLHGNTGVGGGLSFPSSNTGNLGTRDYDSLSTLGGTGGVGGGSNYKEYDYRGGAMIDRGGIGNLNRITDTVLVSNLPPAITWQMLRDKFRDYGDIKYVEMKSADSGIVRFATDREAERAISLLDRTRFDGRIIDVTPY